MSSCRIESYIHSDSITENRAGALVKVSAQTGFAVKTDCFKDFCKNLARFACGTQVDDVKWLLNTSPLGSDLENLKKELKEEIKVISVVTMCD